MKKMLSVLLVAALLASTLTACSKEAGKSGNESGNESGNVSGNESSSESNIDETSVSNDLAEALQVTWWGSQTRNERTQAALDLFAEENNINDIDGQFSEWNDYWQKLATASAGHTLPDVVQMDYLYFDQYAKNDLLVDLTPYVNDGTLNLDNVDPNIVEGGKVDGKLYAVSVGTNVPALVYNKAITDAAEVEIKDNMTLEEFAEVSKTIYEKTGYKTNMAYGTSQEILQYMVRSVEGHVLFGENRLGIESADELRPFFEIYEKGVQEGWFLSPDVFAEQTAAAIEQDPLIYGSSPETLSWVSFIWSNQYVAICNAANEDAQLEITTWPAKDATLSNFLKPAMMFSVSVDAANPAMGAKVLDFWTNSTEANKILLGERGVPISETVADEIAGLLSAEEQKTIEFVNDVVKPNSSPVSPPYPEGSAEVSELINQLTEQICYGSMTAEEAAERLFTKGNQIMGQAAE